jgi:hypothetical protein
MTKARKYAQNAVMPRLQPAEIPQPANGALDFPAPPITPQLPAIVKRLPPFPKPIRHNQINPTLPQSTPQWITVIRLVGNNALGPHPGPSPLPPWNPHLLERGFGQGHFVRRGRRQENSERYTLAIGQYHAFRALAALCFTHCGAPFFAGKKVASIKHSSQRNSPRWSNVPNKARQASNQTPRSSHCRNRRQQVAGDGYCGGRSRHRAPDFSTHRMPSTQARFSAAGRPRRGFFFPCGNKFLILVHCWSVSLIRELKPSLAI